MRIYNYTEKKELADKTNSYYTGVPISCITYPTEEARTAKRIILAEKSRRRDVKFRKGVIRLYNGMLENIYNSFLVFDELRQIRYKVEQRIMDDYLIVDKKGFHEKLKGRVEVNKKEDRFHFEHCLVTDTLEKFKLPSETEFGIAMRDGKKLTWDPNIDSKAIEDYMYEIVFDYNFGDFSYPEDRIISVDDPDSKVETIGA